MLVHRIELKNQHIATMAKYGVDTSRIRIESVFTEVRRLASREKPLLLVLDEAHLAKAASWERTVEFFDTWTVGFSATPCRLDGRPLGDIFECMVTGITHKELEKRGNLAPYDYYAPVELDLSGVKKAHGDFVQGEVEDLVCTRTVYGDVVDSYRKFAEGRMTIAYCVSVKHAQEVAEMFNSVGISARNIDGSMNKATRSDIMQQYKCGNIKVLTAVNLLSEGIDIAEIDCVMMLRPTDSLALYIQQSCRCLRADPNNKEKRAVIIDMVGNYSRHGLPDSDREYSLETGVKAHKEYDEEGSLNLRQCSYCFKVFRTAPICPFCGEQYDLKPRELKKKEDIRLEKLDKEKVEAERLRKLQVQQDIRNARSRKDFEEIARKNGYSRAWVEIRCKLRKYR